MGRVNALFLTLYVMSNPQTEDGYTKIANELLEALIKIRMNGTEWDVTMSVIRRTYGFGKKEDWISYTQFQKMTGKTRPVVWKAIESLVTKKILVTKKELGRTIYSLNKRYSEWVVAKSKLVTKKKRGSYKKETRVVNKSKPTKESITKETLQKKVLSKDNTGKPDEFGNAEINRMLSALKAFTGRDDFKESKRLQRQYGLHFVRLLEKIGKVDFRSRIESVLSDDFKSRNCNSLRYLYGEIKSAQVLQPAVKKTGGIAVIS